MTTAQAKYEVTIKGQYVAKVENGDKTAKPYEVQIKTPELYPNLKSVAKNRLLPSLLGRKYPDFYRLRTYDITHTVDLENPKAIPPDIGFMSMDQLRSHIQKRRLPIETELFTSPMDLRAAIKRYEDSPEHYVRWQTEYKAKAAEDAKLFNILEALNPDTMDL